MSGTGVTWVAGETGKEGNLNPKRRQLDECTYWSETHKYVGGNNIYNIYNFHVGGSLKFWLNSNWDAWLNRERYGAWNYMAWEANP